MYNSATLKMRQISQLCGSRNKRWVVAVLLCALQTDATAQERKKTIFDNPQGAATNTSVNQQKPQMDVPVGGNETPAVEVGNIPKPVEPIPPVGAAVAPAASLPVPAAKEISAVQTRIRQLFKNEYANQKEGAIRDLALRLNGQGRDDANDAVTRYVLLNEAYAVGQRGRDIERMMHAASDLADSFAVDPIPMYYEAAVRVGPTWKAPESNERLAELCVLLTDVALARGEFDMAGQLLKLGGVAAPKSKNVRVAMDMDRRIKLLNWLRIEQNRVKLPLARLKQAADDIPANVAVGRWYCLVMRNWQEGLPMLAKGGATNPLAAAAIQDMARPADGLSQIAIADVWWDIGEREIGKAQEEARKRAAAWYRLALQDNSVGGLQREAARKRIAEVDAFAAKELKQFGEMIVGNKQYHFYDFPVIHSTAEYLCRAMGGRLPSINSAEEQAALASITDGNAAWIGASDAESEGQWVWPDGSPMAFKAWGRGQPDNAGSNEHYLSIRKDGLWNDVPDRQVMGFILEWVTR